MSEQQENEQPVVTSPEGAEPEKKKKTSVKLVRRVKSKKSEKSALAPELKAPEGAIAEEPKPSAPAASDKPSPLPPAEPKQSSTTTTTTTTTTSTLSKPRSSISVQPEPVRRVSSKKRTQRSGSNVFSMFTQNQVHQFREAFSFIDQDKDGIISKNDIRATFDALGRLCNDRELDEMTKEAPGPINFTMFLSVFGDRVQGTDEEDVVLQAFNMYDEGDGFCKEDKLRHALMTWGEKFTKQECDIILQEAPVDSRGRIDIKRFATLVTRGAEDEEAA